MLSEQVCPECGLPRATRALPLPWLVRHRWWVQFGAFLAAIAVVLLVEWRSWPGLRADQRVGSGLSSAEFSREKFTRADLEAYASGERADGQLRRHWNAWPANTRVPRQYGLSVGLSPPQGRVFHFERYGWPSHLVAYRSDSEYADVYDRSTIRPVMRMTALADQWDGWTHFSSYTGPAGDQCTRIVDLNAVFPAVLIAILAWSIGAAIRRAAAGFLGSVEWAWPLRRLPELLSLACIVAAAVWTAWLPSHRVDRFVPSSHRGMAPTGSTVADAIRLVEEPGGEAKLAQIFLRAIDTLPQVKGGVLVIGAERKSDFLWNSLECGWPYGLLAFAREADADALTAEAYIPLRSAAIAEGWLEFEYEATNGPNASVGIQLKNSELAKLILIVWATRMAPRAGLGLWGWWLRRRERGRIAANRCVGCGYDLRSA